MDDGNPDEMQRHEDLDALARRIDVATEDADALRSALLGRAAGLIDAVIDETFERSGFDRQDLFRAGYLGVINAVYNLDLSRGKGFGEYARNLIKGEIRQHIRERIGRPQLPRWLRSLNRQIEAAEARLLQATGALPSLSDLAEEVNITEEGIAEVFRAREALSYVSLSEEQRKDDPAPEVDVTRIRSKHSTALPLEHRIRIASALERLADLQGFLFHSLFPPPRD